MTASFPASATAFRIAWPILLGLTVLYLPTWWDLAFGLWTREEQERGPIVLAVSLYLIWRQRSAFAAEADAAHPALGWGVLALGLILYVLGRSQEILMFEVGSQIPVLFAVLLMTQPRPVLRALAFPILFLAFMVPLPGFVVDALTGPLKQFVSVVAEHFLHGVGYPIGRSGVTLTVGQYQLQVADACSGLHSIFSLSALGLLYLYLVRHPGWLRNGLLIASILPIAIAANVVRVILLILITYHFGDAAGQGFVHGFSGVTLFLAGILFLYGLDSLIGLMQQRRPAPVKG